jgi:hypothetical protein
LKKVFKQTWKKSGWKGFCRQKRKFFKECFLKKIVTKNFWKKLFIQTWQKLGQNVLTENIRKNKKQNLKETFWTKSQPKSFVENFSNKPFKKTNLRNSYTEKFWMAKIRTKNKEKHIKKH